MKVRATFFSLLSLFLLASSVGSLRAESRAVESRYFELRTYYTHEGKLDELHARFRDHTCRLFAKHGMENLGYWTPKDQPDTLIYLLGFADKESCEQSWKDFIADEEWKKVYAASTQNGKLVAKIENVFLEMTDYSKQPSEDVEIGDKAPRLFELRTYTTLEGRLDALNARFRDHTLALFEKHGIDNYAYFFPTEAKDGKGKVMTYIVAHKDAAAKDASWNSFKVDAEWKKVRKASEVSGKILKKKGIESTLLVPTDYSPVK